MTIKTRPSKIIIIVIAVLSIFYLSVSFIYKPIVSNDTISGMLSLNNHLNGDAWNKTLALSKDASHVVSHELTWWSPGQYEIPYLLAKLLGISISTAIVLLVFTSLIGGCIFYYKVFKSSLIEHKIILAALLILLCQRFLNIYFIQYYSSDIFLFFLTPFYIYCYKRVLNNNRQLLVLKLLLLTAINIAGAFIKSSFILFELAVNTFFVLEYFVQRKNKSGNAGPGTSNITLTATILLTIPFVLANVLNYLFFLRLGENPTSSPGLLLSGSNILKSLFLPVTHVLFSSLSLNSIYGNFYNKVILSNGATDLIMAAVLLAVAYIIYRYRLSLWNELKKESFARLVAVVAIMYILFWLIFTLKQSNIFNEDRLYLPAAILVLPYLLRFSFNSLRSIRYFYIAAIGFSILYGGYTFVYRIKKYAIDGSVASKSQKLPAFKVFTDNENVNDLDKIADTIKARYPNDYILVSNPDVAFKLNVSNKFIVIFGNTATSPDSGGIKASYLVLNTPAKNILSPLYKVKKVCVVGGLSLYRSY